jgi:LysR family transcriptional regulator for bpeEF and oprC
MMVACMLDLGKLQLVMTDTRSTGKPVWIVYPQKKHLSARVQAFIEWVRELFERTNEPQFRAPARVSPEPTASTAALA